MKEKVEKNQEESKGASTAESIKETVENHNYPYSGGTWHIKREVERVEWLRSLSSCYGLVGHEVFLWNSHVLNDLLFHMIPTKQNRNIYN